ncbi:hypothetical protein DFR86_07985 [Acidianus sulfidivorans JP7]|uniref:Uncharacterized protein n=1 Tax=Acidianus sulfidivorans JP7 TaxID=619593 RepID=A0A2U9ING4_9CREN|nr:hypothetical protein [Acidianus sulfidivorans]AWR97494.1 hypothetical protein DFR86_07985 [Acidianus sulfidivorans JP7]
MEEEEVADLIANLFPPIGNEISNIFIHNNEFIVINADLLEGRMRSYKGKILRSKIVFSNSNNNLQLSVNTKHIKKVLKASRITEYKKYSIWSVNKNKRNQIILPLDEIVSKI